MSNYAPLTPRDKGDAPKQGYRPAKVALASTTKPNASASSILLLNDNTAEIEVAAQGQNIAGKWFTQAVIDSSVAGTSVITDAGTANYDFFVAQNTVRNFVLPIVSQVLNMNSVAGVRGQYGLPVGVGYKTFAGTGSVLTIEL